MGPSEKTQHAIRRSTRLPLEVPVLVTSLDPARPFSEPCHTTLVNAHGCGLIVGREMAHGIAVRLEIVPAKRYTTARVAEVVPLGGNPEAWLIGLELDVAGNFWGIEYAPSDWKTEEAAAPAREQPQLDPRFDWRFDQAAGAAAQPARCPCWRLADISAGACYLETAAPFPAGTPVLLNVQASDKEYLLEGVVRVSHAQTGMGVEFTRAEGQDQRAKIEELIGRLMSNREVPKIFVGRKGGYQEDGKENPRAGWHEAAKQASGAAQADKSSAASDDECSDPLLELVRQGAALPTERFLNDLRRQRLGNRSEARIDIALLALLTGTDGSGRPLDQRVMTVNVSRLGAQLQGIHGTLGPGDSISLARSHKKEEFRVAWAGEKDTPGEGRIGVAALDPNTTFWDEVLKAAARFGLETASLYANVHGNIGNW